MVSHTVDTTERIASLRAFMSIAGPDGAPLHAYVVPSEDQHFSEYGAKCDERRAFISGFNGSAGCAIITDKSAYLFTDGRYFLQAEQQLDRNWTLMKQGLPDVPTWQEFLHQKLPHGSRIGMDPTLISATDAQKLDATLQPMKSSLVSVSENLVDKVWGTDRPPRPTNRAFPLSTEFAGCTHTDKLSDVRAEVKKAKASALIVSALDEVAWLFNLRGSDVDYNPVFFGYAIVTPESSTLFVDLEKLDDAALKHLGDAVKVQPYTAFWDALKKLGEGTKVDSKVLISDKASFAVFNALGGASKVTMAPSPVALLKSRKNETEVAGFRASHIRDGAALARYFSWLERTLEKGEEEVTEWSAAAVLEKFRSEGEHFVGLSFPTISSTGPNGAIIHYAPEEKDCAVIRKDQVYLCDSGAQYLDGTTDVTRTWHFGTPKDEEKRAFTRVLQGHIAIDTAVFPSGTTGYIIDSWARRALWKDGLDYRHGTGHGVGHFLNVHEGPQGIGVRIAYNSTPLEVGMTVSNEPGYYADGRFGIRIESVVVVRKSETPNNFGDKGYLEFENLTMCPIHKKMIDVSLLSLEERKWVDSYHEEVWEKVSPLLKKDPEARAWLERETAPL